MEKVHLKLRMTAKEKQIVFEFLMEIINKNFVNILVLSLKLWEICHLFIHIYIYIYIYTYYEIIIIMPSDYKDKEKYLVHNSEKFNSVQE